MATAKKKTNTPDTGNLKLAGELNIFRIAQLKDDISAHLKNAQCLTLDLAGAEEVDTSFLQLLIQVKNHCDSKKIDFAIENCNEPVLKIIQSFNMGEFFKNEISTDANKS